MKIVLMREFSIPSDRIIIDPYALHSTTNLRNAARFMLQYSLQNATIVADFLQTFYFSHDWISQFYERCIEDLGYVVGDMEQIGLTQTSFVPSNDCWKVGTDPSDP